MSKATHRSRGFTLITSLLLLMVMSGVAVGLLYMVDGAGHVGANDLESNMAYYGAESGMEKLTTDLASLYNLKLSPTQIDLDALASTSAPSGAQINGMTYVEKAKWTTVDGNGNPVIGNSVISSGTNQGLMAEIVPITLQVTATRPSGASVNMTRGVQVALIPVFQFGVFSDSDLSYFPGPPFAFKGRVHTNGNLFLAANSGPLTIAAKITAVNQIIRDRLPNNYAGAGYDGIVYVPNTTGGCDAFINGGAQGSNCLDYGPDTGNSTNDASWSGGIPPSGSPNPNWAGGTNISTSTFNGMIGNASSIGVQALQLPFVQGATGGTADQQIQILRKPVPGEAATSPLGGSREFNKANIRIFFADTQPLLHPDRPALADGQDINLVVPAPNAAGIVAGGVATSTAYANSASDTAWNVAGLTSPRPLYDGWVRVEYLNTTGSWIGVTAEWLKLGFARGILPPGTPLTGNTVNPRAILILQQLADRNGDGVLNGSDTPSGVNSNYSWYPINFYDAREGFPRDHTTLSSSQCTSMGIMNAVELDVGNLRQWLLGTIPGSGQLVDPSNQNGYLVYFSDRRGMNANPHSHPIANVIDGDPGLENTINSGVGGNGSPGDNILEPITPGYNNSNGFSPEDVDENGFLDRFGETNISTGFGINSPTNPYATVANCSAVGRANKVTGARHVLKLVDGALGNLPTLANNTGGFTVVAENPVYVLGNYNASAAEAFWTNANAADVTHSAAAVIADSVTLLSNNWSDLGSMLNATNLGGRSATTTYYRLAIASGKNMNFPQPNGEPQDFGTDGGVHNFLRYLETWPGGTSLYYRGSLISLYYSEYATGTFKCCNLVYGPPDRHYSFDTLFLVPSNLPPGTPLLQDINNLTYWQDFRPCTNQASGTCTN